MREEQILIEGEKILLRPIEMGDTGNIVRWRNNPQVRNKFIFRQPFTPKMHEAWMKTKVACGEVVQYIIVERKSRREIGSVYFRDIDRVHSRAEFGIFIGEESAKGKGYGTEATKLFTEYGFTVLKLHRISLRVLSGNEGAVRSYQKAGFVQEGIARDMVKLDGKYADVVFMAKISEKRISDE